MKKKLNILVTGGAGFIGSHIVDAYIAAGHRVTVFDNLSTGKRSNVNSKARFFGGDVQRWPDLDRLFYSSQAYDVVNHHAAQIDVRKSVEYPLDDARANVLGTVNVLVAARTHKAKRIIFASSGGACYGECPRFMAEGDDMRPISPYGAGKLAGEGYAGAFHEMYRTPTVILRYGNVYGPRQDGSKESGVIPIFMRKMLNGGRVDIFGDGEQVRDYVFVRDVAEANLRALDSPSGTFNVGSGRPSTVNAVYWTVGRACDIAAPLLPRKRAARRGEIRCSQMSVTKAGLRNGLNWMARTSLIDGIRETFLKEYGEVKP